MRDARRVFPLVCLLLVGAAPQQGAPSSLRDADRLLEQAASADALEAARLAREAADQIDRLAVSETPRLTPELRGQLRRAAEALRAPRRPSSDTIAQTRALLASTGRSLDPTLSLEFQGSLSRTPPKEPVAGGHSIAMAPPTAKAPDPFRDSPVQLVESTRLDVKTYCGGKTKDHILESGGTGVALFDYDGDGRLDVYLVNAYELTASRERVPHKNALFRNLGGWKFQDVSAAARLDAAAWGNGVCAGDYDGDGRLDLYVTNWGPNFLFRNGGDGTFAETASKAGVQAGGWSTGCAFLDADADGDLDLYVARYVSTTWDDLKQAKRSLTWRGGPNVMTGPTGLPGEPDLFFENQGNGTFLEKADAYGLTDRGKAYGFGVVATDYDGDGRVDLFVANDTNPNFLYRNLGQRRFQNAALTAGVATNVDGRAQAGMGADAGDYDGDGRTDLVLTTFAHDTYTLFRNLDGGLFEDATVRSGLAAPTFERMGWGTAFADMDQDGDLDLLFANGHIYPNVDDFPELRESFRQKSQLFLNAGSGVLRDASAASGPGLQLAKSYRGMAVGDLDGDGDLDVVLSSVDDAPTLLENRQRTGNHWAAFALQSAGPNRLAIGARVTVSAGGKKQFREVRSGGGYLSQNALAAHFGLGAHAAAVDVEVTLGSRRWSFPGLAPDKLHVLKLF